MKRVLSFGGGVQTTAMAILVAQGKIQCDEIVFADTGAEKPETYWYMDNYTKPLFKELGIFFTTVTRKDGTLVDYCKRYRMIPEPQRRWCTHKGKIEPILKYIGEEAISLIGFSSDESHRAERAKNKEHKLFPLIEMGIGFNDSLDIIKDYGWPIPLRSSCYFCPFQPYLEWNWLKREHPELIQKCLELEELYYNRRNDYPHLRHTYGLFGGKPLWKWVEGIQSEWEFPGEYSCYSGDCGH